jgi:hypothetical protein
MEKPFAFGEKPPPLGIPINARQPVITPDAFSRLINSPLGALQIHSHTLPSFHVLSSSSSREKPPKAMADKGK